MHSTFDFIYFFRRLASTLDFQVQLLLLVKLLLVFLMQKEFKYG